MFVFSQFEKKKKRKDGGGSFISISTYAKYRQPLFSPNAKEKKKKNPLIIIVISEAAGWKIHYGRLRI